MMVLIAFGIGALITYLIGQSVVAQDITYCSKSDRSMDQAYFPITSVKALNDTNTDRNYFTAPAASGALRRPVVFGSDQSCVYWFGKDYPFSSPYERQPSLFNPDANRDTTYRPQPLGGWFRNEYNPKLIQYQMFPWWIILSNPSIDLGIKSPSGPLDTTQFSSATTANQSGTLGKIPINFYWNLTESRFRRAPYYLYLTGTDDDMDDIFAEEINNVLDSLAKVNKRVLITNEPDPIDLFVFYRNISTIMAQMPFGGLTLEKFDTVNKEFIYTITAGTDRRLAAAVSFPVFGFRRLLQQANLADAIAQTVLGGKRITAGFRAMPQVESTGYSVPIGSAVGTILYPFGVSFLLAIFVLILVKEKEDRIEVMMRMNGLSSWSYYVTHYIHFYILHIFASMVFILAGLATGLDFFVKTNAGVYILLFFFWGHAQVALSFVLSVFFDKNRTALVMTFLIVVVGVIVNLATGNILWADKPAPTLYLIWAPFAFYRGLQMVNRASYDVRLPPYTVDLMFSPGDEVGRAVTALIMETFVYLIIAAYLRQVIRSEYGVQKPWYFPIAWIFKCIQQFRNVSSAVEEQDVESFQDELEGEDLDVKNERKRVLNKKYVDSCPVVMAHMRKDYSSGNSKVRRVACKDVTLAIESNVIFGLLGPNGAGKTTLISILTGLYPPTSGKATIAGFDVSTQMDDVYRVIGICPQHDILWDDLTVEEHLLFYARLKGIPSELEQKFVHDSIERVDLQKYTNTVSKSLSGGAKRRLSIAIALVGAPKVVFLDEPTTGLDPEVRRQIWTIVNDAKLDKTVILTTHSMEEAEVLCHRIGIMAKGNLRCLGGPIHLKKLYGSGFKLQLNMSPDCKNARPAEEFIESLLPSGQWKKIDSFALTTSYEFKMSTGVIKTLFDQLASDESVERKRQLGIDDWGLTQTSLDEVFLRIIKESDADAD